MSLLLVIAFSVMCGLLILFFCLGVGRVLTKRDQNEQFHTMIDSITKSEIALNREDANVPDPKTWSGYWYSISSRSGIEWNNNQTPGILAMGLPLFFFGVGFLVWPGDIIGGLGGAAIALLGLRGYFISKSKGRLKAMDKQLPSLLSGIRANLQANLTPQQAIVNQAKEVNQPLKGELETLTQDMSVGISLDIALQNFSSRVPSREVQFLVSAIRIAISSGADLDPLVANIQSIVVQRTRIANHLASAVAKVQPAIYVTGVMIPAAFAYSFYSSDTNRAFWTSLPNGIIAMAIIGGLYALGLFIAKKQVDRVKEA